MNRISKKLLQARIETINSILEMPETPYTRTDEKLVANIGNFSLSQAYGGYCVHRMVNENGGVSTPIWAGHIKPMRGMFYPSRFFLLIIMKKLSKDYYFELAQFCMDYHSGQWSRGYRIISRLRPSNFSSSLSEELRESEAYHWLVENYAEKI